MTPIKRADNGYRRGDSHHRAKLTDHEVELARRMREKDPAIWTFARLAKAFEISAMHMARLCRFEQRV